MPQRIKDTICCLESIYLCEKRIIYAREVENKQKMYFNIKWLDRDCFANIIVIKKYKNRRSIEMKNKKMLSSVVCCVMLLTTIFLTNSYTKIYASDWQNLKEGPSVEFDLGASGSTTLQKDVEGNYNGQINAQSSTGVTVVKCFMSARTGGIDGLYEIYISWSGTNQVANIKASSLKITSTSILSPKTYYNKSFFINGGSSLYGSRTIGTVYISPTVKKVRVKTTGLKCYFNNRDYWVSTGNLNGTINLK